jgi:hypothetical protein
VDKPPLLSVPAVVASTGPVGVGVGSVGDGALPGLEIAFGDDVGVDIGIAEGVISISHGTVKDNVKMDAL